MHGRVRRTVELEQRTSELERTCEAERLATIARSGGRIAGELHEVIAHSLSVIVVQAGAPRK